MFEKFTDRSRRVVVLAQEEARSMGHAVIETEHILAGLVAEDGGIAAQALKGLGVWDVEQVRLAIKEIRGPVDHSPVTGHMPFTTESKSVFENALREALQMGHNYIGTEHLLLGLLRQSALVTMSKSDTRSSNAAVRILEGWNITPDAVRTEVMNALGRHTRKEQPPHSHQPAEWVSVERDDLIDECERYLLSLHTAHWGKGYDMFQEDSRKRAATWLADEVLRVTEFMQEEKK